MTAYEWIGESNWRGLYNRLTRYVVDPDDQGMIRQDQMPQNQTIHQANEIVHHYYQPRD